MTPTPFVLVGFLVYSAPSFEQREFAGPSQITARDAAFFTNHFVLRKNARIAQLVEHITDTDGVLGSNPSARTLDVMFCPFVF